MTGHHNPRCADYNPDCPCRTCARDNYRQRTYIQCCAHHRRACNMRRVCRDYTPETTTPETEKPNK